MAKNFTLGRGLSSLIPPKKTGENLWGAPGSSASKAPQATGDAAQAPHKLPLSAIELNPNQPRKTFDEASLAELAASISAHGILQPLVVSPAGNGKYHLIAGERRFRAAHIVGMDEVPVVIRDASEQERMTLALVENIQRQNLNPMEEAAAYAMLRNEFNLTQEEVAKRVGKSRSAVANMERLLTLPRAIQDAVRVGAITVGHAKVILSLETAELQEKFFREITSEGLPVHLAEVKAQRYHKPAVRRSASAGRSSAFPAEEQALQRALQTKVKVRGNARGGVVQVLYYSLEELREIVKKIVS